MDLTNSDVEDILAVLDSLPYDELDLRTSRFRLILRRTPDGWTQSTEPVPAAGSLPQPAGDSYLAAAAASQPDDGSAVVRAPLPGTFYRAPRPGAAPFVAVGSRVDADTVVGIVETMKLMNSVPAGTAGRVTEICAGNADFVASGATLMHIEADA